MKRLDQFYEGAETLGYKAAACYALQGPGDGVTDASPAMAVAITSGRHIEIYPGTFLLNSSHAPATVLIFHGMLKLTTGHTFDVSNCAIVAPPGLQIFDVSGGGTVIGTPDNESAYHTWWGSDPTYATDSVAAIQAWLTFCSGNRKPKAAQVPGRYKLGGGGTTALLSVSRNDFNLPMIYGIPGQSHSNDPANITTSGYNCIWDASTSTLAVDANGNYPAVLRIKGGSGTMISGGVRDFAIIGNGACNAIQAADGGGIVIDNMRANQVRYGIELYNEGLGGAPSTSGYNIGLNGGFTENVKIVHCAFAAGLAAVRTRRNVDANYTASATNSFHRLTIKDCWFDMPNGTNGASGLYVGVGCDVYNSDLNYTSFFHGVTADIRQYAIAFEAAVDARMPVIPVKAGGLLTQEGGSASNVAYCFWGGPFGTVYWTGGELGISSIKYGSLVPCHSVYRLGSETGAAQGGYRSFPRRPYSFGPVNISSGAALFFGDFQDGLYEVSIDLFATGYDRRITAEIWSITGLTGNVNIRTNWNIDSSTNYGSPTITCVNEALRLTDPGTGTAWPTRSASSAVKSGGNTGTGTLTMDGTAPVSGVGINGVYKVRCIATDAGGGIFKVTMPNGWADTIALSIGGGTILSPKLTMSGGAGTWAGQGLRGNGSIRFALAAGGTAFEVGDGFDVTVSGGIAACVTVYPKYANRASIPNGFNTMGS